MNRIVFNIWPDGCVWFFFFWQFRPQDCSQSTVNRNIHFKRLAKHLALWHQVETVWRFSPRLRLGQIIKTQRADNLELSFKLHMISFGSKITHVQCFEASFWNGRIKSSACVRFANLFWCICLSRTQQTANKQNNNNKIRDPRTQRKIPAERGQKNLDECETRW